VVRKAVLLLERVDLLARGEDAVVDVVTCLLEHLLGAHAERAGVVGQDHAVERGAGLVWHGELRRV
jgi:hypothetical protein